MPSVLEPRIARREDFNQTKSIERFDDLKRKMAAEVRLGSS